MNAAERELYNSPAFAGYSLWLSPAAESEGREGVIRRCELEACVAAGVEADTTGAARRFPPHVTLLGGFNGTSEEELKAKTAALAEKIAAALLVPVQGVQTQELYFQCVYVLCRPTEALAAANAEAQEVFAAPKPGYMPHLSLVYGRSADLGGEAAKQALAAALASELGVPCLGPREAAAGQHHASEGCIKALCLNELQLWDTNGRAHEWKLVASYALPDA